MTATIIHAKAANILLDEFDFSGVTNSVELAISNNLADVTAFNDTDATFVEGKPSFKCGVNGLWEPSAGGYDAEMFTDLTATSRALGIWPDTFVTGKRGYELSTIVAGYPIAVPVGNFIAANVNWQGDLPAVRAYMLHYAAALGSTATGTAYNVGAPTATQTIYGVLRVMSVGGAGSNTLDVVIQSDTAEAFASPTARLTFTQVTTSVTFSIQSAAGALAGETWWRAVLTYAGVGTRTYKVAVSFGIRPT